MTRSPGKTSRTRGLLAPVGFATTAGATVGLVDAILALVGGRVAAPFSLLVVSTSLGTCLALAASLPLVLAMALARFPRSTGGRLGALAGWMLSAPVAVALGRELYKRIPWTTADVALGALGVAGIVVATLALGALGGRSLGSAPRLGRVFAWAALPGLLAAFPVGGRALIASVAPFGRMASGSEGRTNLLLLTVDTLRADCLGHQGDPAARTPHLDRLARRSWIAADCIAPSPWTLPSLASLLTGSYPGQHLVLQELSGLSSGVPTLAEVCRRGDLRTGAFVSNPWLATGNLERGFDTFDVAERLEIVREASATHAVRILTKTLLRLGRLDAADNLSRRGIEWLDRGRGNWFLWLHYFDPHLPNWPARPYDRLFGPRPTNIGSSLTVDAIRAGAFAGGERARQEIEALYDAEVAYTDRNVGTVIRHLETRGALASTAIVFSADHGEEFWEHLGYGHGHTMFDEVVRVPLFVRPVGGAPVRIDPTLTRLVDVAPTAAAAAGLALPDSPGFLGRDLLSSDGPPPATFGEAMLYGDEQKFVRTTDWKLVLDLGSGDAQSFRLYDVRADPAELRDLADELPALRDSLGAELASWMKELGSESTLSAERLDDLDPAVLEQLKTLGYVE